jgi:hypothetical protein
VTRIQVLRQQIDQGHGSAHRRVDATAPTCAIQATSAWSVQSAFSRTHSTSRARQGAFEHARFCSKSGHEFGAGASNCVSS